MRAPSAIVSGSRTVTSVPLLKERVASSAVAGSTPTTRIPGYRCLAAIAQPDSFLAVSVAVSIEQFGYGFGFTAFTLYMIYASRGEHSTAHFAICTGFMALGMMLPGMFSGALQEWLGYRDFFIWILAATVPSFVVVALVPLDPDFGRKHNTALP